MQLIVFPNFWKECTDVLPLWHKGTKEGYILTQINCQKQAIPLLTPPFV